MFERPQQMDESQQIEIFQLLKKFSTHAKEASGLRDFLRACLKPICSVLDVQAASIFLTDSSNDTLRLAATTGLSGNQPEHSVVYRFGEGLTGSVALQGKALFVTNMDQNPQWRGKYKESVAQKPGSFLAVPLLWYSGRTLGVLRCVTYAALSQETAKSKIDLIQSISFILSPYIAAAAAEELQTMSIERMTHELKSSLVAIKSTVQMLEHSEQFLSDSSKHRIHDVITLCNMLMTSVESKSLAFGKSVALHREKTLFFSQILMPASAMLKHLLDDRGLTLRITDNVRNSPANREIPVRRPYSVALSPKTAGGGIITSRITASR
jgi:signal transduction protein with GAF and PtsI domain